MKTEPESYSIDDLRRDKRTSWTGVRNYQARNFMRDEMKRGDMVLLYHSGAEPGVAGVARVSREAHPDLTALDRKDDHFDPKATKENPIWSMVEIEFVEKLSEFVPLAALKTEKSLAGMLVLKRGQRLSVMPVDEKHFKTVCKLGGAKSPVA